MPWRFLNELDVVRLVLEASQLVQLRLAQLVSTAAVLHPAFLHVLELNLDQSLLFQVAGAPMVYWG